MKLTYFFLGWAIFVICFVAIAGFRGDHSSRPPMEIFPDMIYQGKVKDQTTSKFFADGIAARAPIPGTVAIEMPSQANYWATGKWDATHWGDGIPVHPATADEPALQIDLRNLERGRERYTIYCSMCHGQVGLGNGITSKYGLPAIASYHTDRLRTEADGALYDTVNNGKNTMMGYGSNISIDDRWRIVMYVRALQYSEYAPLADAPQDVRDALNNPAKGTKP
jgi:mono/diheme cytochrome c family protein